MIPISFAIFTNILCNFKTLTFVIQLQIILFRNNKFYLHFVCNLPQSFAVYRGYSICSTVANFQIGWKAILWSKMLILMKVFHKLIVLPHICPPQNFWPLTRAFKWCTIKGFSSRGIRMAKGQSFRLLTLLNKK